MLPRNALMALQPSRRIKSLLADPMHPFLLLEEAETDSALFLPDDRRFNGSDILHNEPKRSIRDERGLNTQIGSIAGHVDHRAMRLGTVCPQFGRPIRTQAPVGRGTCSRTTQLSHIALGSRAQELFSSGLIQTKQERCHPRKVALQFDENFRQICMALYDRLNKYKINQKSS